MDKPQTPWIHELYDNLMYRWLRTNALMRNDKHGIEIAQRWRDPEDVICGARTIKPGMPGATAPWWFPIDISQDAEMVCAIVGDHDEMPHIGVPADCADQICECYLNGSDHLVIIGMMICPEPSIDLPSYQGRTG